MRKKLIVIAGPTAVGKTSVAIHLAKEFRTAIVSADSRQIYREMNVGTAKPTAADRAAVPHYFIDTHSVADTYDAASYATDALGVVADLFTRHDEVILCGGSGLYIKGVCDGFDEMPDIPEGLRNDLIRSYREHGLPWLQERMRDLDPDAMDSIDIKNPHRLIRALEVKLASGESIMSFRKNKKHDRNFISVKIGLELPREELYNRIDTRMNHMIGEGLFEEARTLYPLRHYNALQTVGYQEIFDFIDKRYDRDECIRLLKRNSRRYAKRQLTWFKKDPGFRWFSPHDFDAIINYIQLQP